MADLRRTRKQLVVVASALAVISVAAIVYLLFPVGASNAELNDQLAQTNKELEMREAQVRPLRGLPEKLVKTNQDIVKFYRDRLPARQSDISEELGKLASAQGVTLSDVKYENYDTDIPDLKEVMVQAQLSGEYSRLAHFINAAERDKTFLIVNEVTLDEQKGGSVRLQMRFETYLRPAFAELASVDKPAEIKLPAKTNTSKAAAPSKGKQ